MATCACRLTSTRSASTSAALVALVTDTETREPISLHFTWVCPDGSKANTPGPARLLLGGHRKAGGCIRLWPDEAVTTAWESAKGSSRA